MVEITIEISEELYAKVVRLAAERGCTISDIVNEALREYLDRDCPEDVDEEP